MPLPDFIIIGAMKCATSSLHDQLAQQPGVFMSTPKEPCFFSDDDIYAKGIDWYHNLFASAESNDICGESSTHYTKRPRLGHSIERLQQHLTKQTKFIYVVRHPIDRLVSHYVHDWTENTIHEPIDEAIDAHRDLIDFSLYSMQLQPFIEAFGTERLLLVPFDGILKRPQSVLDRIAAFIEYDGQMSWHTDDGPSNVSSQRLRKNGLRDALVWNPVVTALRRALIPQSLRDRVKSMWQMKKRPILSDASVKRLTTLFDADLKLLSQWVGRDICCNNFTQVTMNAPLDLLNDNAIPQGVSVPHDSSISA